MQPRTTRDEPACEQYDQKQKPGMTARTGAKESIKKRSEVMILSKARILCFILALFMCFCTAAPAMSSGTVKAGDGLYTSLSQMHGLRIGVQSGTTYDKIALSALPDAQLSYYNSIPDMVTALQAQKIDGFPCDEPILFAIMRENSRITLINESMDDFSCAFVFGKNDHGNLLSSQMSGMIEEMKAGGELDRLADKWVIGDCAAAEMPDLSLPARTAH